MAFVVQVPPLSSSFCSRPPLCIRGSKPTVRRKHQSFACATPTGPAGDDGASPIAAADLKLLSRRVDALRNGLIAEDRTLARKWTKGEHTHKVVASVPGAHFVRRVAADGNLLACGTADGMLCLFDTVTGERAIRENANSGQTTAVSISGSYLVSVGSADQAIAVWDVRAYRGARDWSTLGSPTLDGPALHGPLIRFTGHDNIVTALAIDARNRTLHTGSVDGTLRSWCLETGALRHVVDVGEPVLCMTLAGRYLLAGTASGRVQAYHAARGSYLLSLQAHESPTTALSFNDDSQVLASASASGDMKIWDYNNGRLLAQPRPHNGPVMALNLDDNRLVSASRDGTIAVTNAADAERLYDIPGYTVFITSLVVDRDRIISDGTNNLITGRSFALR